MRLSHVVGCSKSTPAQNAGLSGSFYDWRRNGEGIIVQWLPNGQVLAIFFTYDLEGNQMWIFGTGPAEGKSVTIDAVYPTTFTTWGRNFDPDDVTLTPWGTFTLEYTHCDSVTFSYESSVPGYGSAVRYYNRLSRLMGLDCPEF